MKIRGSINDNTTELQASIRENQNKIIVLIWETNALFNGFTEPKEEKEFSTITEFEKWAKEQEWIKRIRYTSKFQKVEK